MPTATITMSGSPECAKLYKHCSKRHPRLLFVRNKELGVALLELPASLDSFLTGSERKVVRNSRTRCLAKGYRFEVVKPAGLLDQVIEINSSKSVRQGRPMDSGYLDPNLVAADLCDFAEMPAVFDPAGHLVAYAFVPICGQMANLSRLLGHADHLDNGVMYLLIAGIIGWLAERPVAHRPRLLMYDTFLGAGDGLRGFKTRFGFKAYRVRWVWSS